MKKFLFPLFLALTSISACGISNEPAYAAPPGFSMLVEKAMRSDYVLHTMDGDYRVLKHTVPADAAQTHVTDYFSVVGGVLNNRFYPNHVAVVAETWVKQKDGTWLIDQWTFSVSLDGEQVMKVPSHNAVHERADGTIIPTTQPRVPTENEMRGAVHKIETRWRNWIKENAHG